LSPLFGGDYSKFVSFRSRVAEFIADRGIGEAIRGEALGFIRELLADPLSEGLRKAELLLDLPSGALGLSGACEAKSSLANWGRFRDWEQPRMPDWLTLVFALSSGLRPS